MEVDFNRDLSPVVVCVDELTDRSTYASLLIVDKCFGGMYKCSGLKKQFPVCRIFGYFSISISVLPESFLHRLWCALPVNLFSTG